MMKTYDWWCPDCNKGCDTFDNDGNERLAVDPEGYYCCPNPNCGARVMGFDEFFCEED